MVSAFQRILRSTDATVAAAYLSLFNERGGLIPLLFHSLFRDESEIARNVVDPLDRTTVAHFRSVVEYFLSRGYRFVTPEEVLAGLPPGGRYAMLTFDDGYYNNTLALPVLEGLNVPAVFFISADNVRLGKCFWWDVLYRERLARGATARAVQLEGHALKLLPTERIERRLKSWFGDDCLAPRGDIDRPSTPAELKEFAQHPRVRIGNHTADHAILTNYTPEEARAQVVRAQQWLAEVTGVEPVCIAYPNGDHSDAVVRACREAGLKLGFTVRPHKTALPLNGSPDRLLRIGRFTPHVQSPVESQCRAYRSDLQLYDAFRSTYLKLSGRATR
jgi:peptidoglycan/xylan/chitin deacetylase (PgdA/CDA1 family)